MTAAKLATQLQQCNLLDSDTIKMCLQGPVGTTHGEIAKGTRSAADKVFGTYELAEMIFAHLAPPDLVRVSGVCKGAKNVMEDSEKLEANFYAFTPCRDAIYVLFPSSTERSKSRFDVKLPLTYGSEPKYCACLSIARKAHQIQLQYVLLSEYMYGCRQDLWGPYTTQRRTLLKPNGKRDSGELWRKMKLLQSGSMEAAESEFLEKFGNSGMGEAWRKEVELLGACSDKSVKVSLGQQDQSRTFTEFQPEYLEGDCTLGQVYDTLCEMAFLWGE